MKYQIIRGDNFNRDYYPELVVLCHVEKEDGELAVDALNKCCSVAGPYFFRIEPIDYVPSKEFTP